MSGSRFLTTTLTIACILGVTSLSADSKRFPVDNFQKSSVGSLPKGWKGRSDDATKYYKVAKDDSGNRYLRVQNRKTHEFVITEAKVDLVKFPYLEWRWRANSLPPGGNESLKSKGDSGAAVNVVISASKWKPKTIKYVWSSTLKKGTVTKSPYCKWPGKCDVIVLQSGKGKMGQWVSERRDVLADYKLLYDRPSVKEIEIDAILIMSDGDNTKSLAAADYDDIRFTK